VNALASEFGGTDEKRADRDAVLVLGDTPGNTTKPW